MKNKIGLISLGCAKNLVDTENLVSQLIKNGYETADDYHEADLVIINTCGFINEAIQESLDTIADAVAHHGKVIVTGCLGKRKDLILGQFPKVLHVGGPAQTAEIIAAVKLHLPLKKIIPCADDTIIKLTPAHYAYLKIAEGCNHQCSYCIIPQIRGGLVSRSMSDILFEAEKLAKQGVKELLVIAQDTAAYGQDLKMKNGIIDLVKKLSELGLWIRLHYVYPYPFIDELVALMAEGKLLPYLDVPLQHCNPRLLKLMQRPGSTEKLLERINTWRKICPDLAIRSTFIVGFPSETDAEFNQLLDFLEEASLDRVGAFKYSPVEGAKANQLSNQIPEHIKVERLDALMQLQTEISAKKLTQKIGKTFPVIIDEIHEDHVIARSKYDSPEVDGHVIIEGQYLKIKPGNIIHAKIIDSNEYDLFGETTSSSRGSTAGSSFKFPGSRDQVAG
jgi:ribosomal protein S12 methylthiotransferase